MKDLPATPIPLVFNVQEHIEEFRDYLDPKNPDYEEHEQQHDNIRTVIRLYKEGKIDGSQGQVFVRDGKIITEEESWKGPGWTWIEGQDYEMAQNYLRMLLRLAPGLGGDGTTHTIRVINDTGSTVLSLFNSDLQHLGNIQGYRGWRGRVRTRSANGPTNTYYKIAGEVSLLRDDDITWSDWVTEDAVVKLPSAGVPRLPGVGIRLALYFGSAPSNHSVAVVTTKGGLNSLL